MALETYTAGGIVLQKQTGKVLLVEQANQTWSLPKGHIDKGEDALDAAIREIKEESGITQLKLIKKLGNYSRYKMDIYGGDDRTELKSMTFFLFRTSEKKLAPEDPNNPSARWVSKEKVPSWLTHRKDKEFFEKCLSSGLLGLEGESSTVNQNSGGLKK